MTNAEFNEIFRGRTTLFAVDILNFIEEVPFKTATKVLIYQLGKAGTSVGANFRSFCRGRSKREKYAKICIVVEEADECVYWLELFEKTRFEINKVELERLSKESLEILKICQKIKSGLSP